MRRLFLMGMLAAFCLAGIWGCRSRPEEPATVRHRFFDAKRVPPKPND
jgi:hypothetical protein